MTKKFKIIFIVLISLVMCGCWNYSELNSLAIATTLGIDKKDNKYLVSLMIANAKSAQVSSKEGQSQIVVLEGKGDTLTEALEAIDLALFNQTLQDLLAGREVEMPSFNFKTGHKEWKGQKIRLEANEVLVIEGIHCLNDKLTPSIPKEQKFKIYISALTVLNIDYYNRISTTDTRIIRRTVRDNQFRSYDAEKTLATWPSVTAGEEKNIFPYQEDADAMFNTSVIYEFNALRNYAIPLFEKIGKDSKQYAEAKRLCEFLKYFEPLPVENIPKNSLIQEFIGNSIFEY